MKNKKNCLICGLEMYLFPSRSQRKYCSYKCMGLDRLGRTSYVRDENHRKRMSEMVRARDQSANKQRMAAIGASRKGKTIEEIWGLEKANIIRTRIGKEGPSNPNWRGGKHRNRYPYVFYALRNQILERDKYLCQNCGMTQARAKERDSLNRGLTIHHIDYEKENNELDNLITLCKWCNSSANSRRKEWQNHYSRLLLGA